MWKIEGKSRAANIWFHWFRRFKKIFDLFICSCCFSVCQKRIENHLSWAGELFTGLSYPSPSIALSFPFFFIRVNDASGGRRHGSIAWSCESRTLMWSIDEEVGGLKRLLTVCAASEGNNHLCVRFHSDRQNQKLTGLKCSSALRRAILHGRPERWAIN